MINQLVKRLDAAAGPKDAQRVREHALPLGCAAATVDNSRLNDYIWLVINKIRTETRPGQPARSLAEQVFVALVRASERLQWQVAEWLKPHELSLTQYNALRILRGAEPAGLPCREIAARMIHRDPDITRLMERLERRGLVARHRGQKDRREILARISAAGLKLVNGMDQQIHALHESLLGEFGDQQLHSLLRLLDALPVGRGAQGETPKRH